MSKLEGVKEAFFKLKLSVKFVLYSRDVEGFQSPSPYYVHIFHQQKKDGNSKKLLYLSLP